MKQHHFPNLELLKLVAVKKNSKSPKRSKLLYLYELHIIK